MKSKKIIYCLMALCLFTLNSCGPDNVQYADKVKGDYNIRITPNLTIKYEGMVIPMTFEDINTKANISKVDEEGNVILTINGINGKINDIVMEAYCSGLGMNLEDSSYDGVIITDSYVRMDCNLTLKNPTVTISNAKVLNWSSTISGKCEMDYNGLPIICEVSGNMSFYATYIYE